MSECQRDDGQNKQDAGWSRAGKKKRKKKKEKKEEKTREKEEEEEGKEEDRGRVKNSGYATIFVFVFHRPTPIDLDRRVLISLKKWTREGKAGLRNDASPLSSSPLRFEETR